jgi:hypothetical protein
MQHAVILLLLLVTGSQVTYSQDLIKGFPLTISLVPKSAKQPNLRLKDGSGITLKNVGTEGLHVVMNKNGKTFDLLDPFTNTSFVQVGETDIEKDGRNEIVIASKNAEGSVDVFIFKKAEFEVFYKEWANFSAPVAVEFPGNGSVKFYDKVGSFSSLRFTGDGKLTGTN